MKRFDFNKDDKDKEYWYIDDSKTNKTYYIDNLEELCDVLNELNDWKTECVERKRISSERLKKHQDCIAKYGIYSVDELDGILEKYYKKV